jgi:hypothetical protein
MRRITPFRCWVTLLGNTVQILDAPTTWGWEIIRQHESLVKNDLLDLFGQINADVSFSCRYADSSQMRHLPYD